MGTRPAIFKWRQTKPGLILRAVRWYLRYFLSLRDVEELLEERGLDVDQAAALKVATHPLLSPQRHRRTIPVTSKQLKFCCLTFPKIRFNALWDFIPARAGSRDIDSLGWTDREFSCFDAILDHKREGHQGERCPGD